MTHAPVKTYAKPATAYHHPSTMSACATFSALGPRHAVAILDDVSSQASARLTWTVLPNGSATQVFVVPLA